jgi:hypothetical protein
VNHPESNEEYLPEEDKKNMPDEEIRKESGNVNVTQPTSPNSHVKPGEDTSHMAFDKPSGWPKAPEGNHSSYYGGKGIDSAVESKGFEEAGHEDNEAEVHHPSSNPQDDVSHYMAVKGASRYLKDLTTIYDLTDQHREEAGQHQKMLQGVLDQGFGPMDVESSEVEVNKPMGDISVKSLIELQKKATAEANEMNRKVLRLAPLVFN